MKVVVASSPRRVMGERALLCGVAVSLLWLSSLSVAQYAVRLVLPRPAGATVAWTARAALTATEGEASRYAECVGAREQTCAAAGAEMERTEGASVGEALSDNDAALGALGAQVGQCEGEAALALERLGELQRAPGGAPLSALLVASEADAAECRELAALVARQQGASAVAGAAAAFGAAGESQVAALADAGVARQAYDLAYVATKRAAARAQAAQIAASGAQAVSGLQDVAAQAGPLYACLGGSGGAADARACAGAPPLLAAVSELRESGGAAYAQAVAAHAELEARVGRVQATVAAFQGAVEAFVGNWAIQAVLWIAGAPPGLDVGRAFAEALAGRVLPPLSAAELSARLGAREDEARGRAAAAVAEHRLRAEAAVRAHAAEQAAASGGQSAAVGAALDDYAPPPLPEADGARQAARNRTRALLQAVQDGVGAVPELPLPPPPPAVPWNASLGTGLGGRPPPAVSTAELIRGLVPGAWSAFLYDGFSWSELALQWGSLSGALLACDTLFRALRSAYAMKKYADLSRPLAPPLLLGRARARAQTQRSPAQRLALIALHPATGAVLALGLSWLVLNAFLVLYLPLFWRFAAACVQTPVAPPAGQGTLLSENALTLATQYAAQGGTRAALAAADRLNAAAARACATGVAEAAARLAQQQAALRGLRDRVAPPAAQVSALARCLELRFADVGLYMTARYSACPAAAAVAPALALREPAYNCSRAQGPPCELACPPPNQAVLRHWTWHAACTAEGFLHGTVFAWVLALAIFLLLNIARAMIVQGLRLILWRHISPAAELTYVACVDLESAATLDQQWCATKAELAERAAGRERAHRRKGAALLALGFFSLLPAPLALHLVSQALQVRA
jgi:hypothetical protein